MMDVRVLVDMVVVASARPALVLAPRVLGRRSGSSVRAGRSVSPFAALAVVTGLIYVNPVLFTVYVLRVHGGDPADTEKDNFAYSYDLNGNMTSIDDTSSTVKIDNYGITYTGLNQIQKVTESLTGTAKKTTSYSYDPDGQPETIDHSDQFSTYTYDTRQLVKTVSVGKSATDASPKATSYTYTDRGQQLKETKANGNTVDYTYYLDAALKTSTEKKANGTLVSSHTYAYDPNGNKAQDVARKMNADNNTAYLDSTTNYTYDPADRLKQSVKTGNGAGTDTYVHDDNANVISQTVDNNTTTYDYDSNCLLSATIGGSKANYNYDPFGRQESVTSGGQIISRNVYDGFDHVIESQKMDDTGAMKSTTYTFDPVGAKNYVRAGHATCWYSRRMPPRRSRRWTSRWVSRSGSAIGSGRGHSGAALARVRWGLCWL